MCGVRRIGFKAGACAYGLTFRPRLHRHAGRGFSSAGQLAEARRATAGEDPKAGFAQSRCEFSNFEKNWLTRAQGLVQDGHFLVEHAAAPMRLAVPVQRHRRRLRRATIERAGGWSDYSLAEDLDLTVRAALDGWAAFLFPSLRFRDSAEGLRDSAAADAGRTDSCRSRRGPSFRLRAPWTLTQRSPRSRWWRIRSSSRGPIGVLAILFGSILHGSPAPYLPMLEVIAVMTTDRRARHHAAAYLMLKRGSLVDYLKTMASVPPLMSISLFPTARKSSRRCAAADRRSRRTPKIEHAESSIVDADVEA